MPQEEAGLGEGAQEVLGLATRSGRAAGPTAGTSWRPGRRCPPLVLDDDEAVALALGLQAATVSPVAGMDEAGVRALAKLAGVLPERLRRRVDALAAVTVPSGWGGAVDVVDPRVLTTLAQTGRDAERVVFGYTTAEGRVADRHVEPHRLLSAGRRWYLVAWDLDRADWRSFRLDRVATARGTGARFAPRPLPAEDLTAFVLSRGPVATPFEVEMVVSAPVQHVRERVGRWAAVADHPDGCRVTMSTDDLDWAAMLAGTVGAEFLVVRPPELVGRLQRWAGLFARATA